MPNSTLIVHGYVHVLRIDTKQNGNFFMSNDWCINNSKKVKAHHAKIV